MRLKLNFNCYKAQFIKFQEEIISSKNMSLLMFLSR